MKKKNFMSFNSAWDKLVFRNIEEDDVGRHTLEIMLVDEFGSSSSSAITIDITKVFNFTFEVVEEEPEPIVEIAPVFEADPSLPEIKAKIMSVSKYGQLIIEFSEEMKS